eukprot:651822-Prorocentrum_minimum.AAC.7
MIAASVPGIVTNMQHSQIKSATLRLWKGGRRAEGSGQWGAHRCGDGGVSDVVEVEDERVAGRVPQLPKGERRQLAPEGRA